MIKIVHLHYCLTGEITKKGYLYVATNDSGHSGWSLFSRKGQRMVVSSILYANTLLLYQSHSGPAQSLHRQYQYCFSHDGNRAKIGYFINTILLDWVNTLGWLFVAVIPFSKAMRIHTIKECKHYAGIIK